METIKELGLLALLGLILYGVLRTVSEFFKSASAEEEQKLFEEEQKRLEDKYK